MSIEKSNDPTLVEPEAATDTDHQAIMKMLKKIQTDTHDGFRALKSEFKQEVKNRVDQVSLEVKQLTARVAQCDNLRTEEIMALKKQISTLELANLAPSSTKPPTMGTEGKPMSQGQNLLRMAFDKQIDELKPYYGKKQENVEIWIKKIDKLAEIAKMPSEEIFVLAQLKLQGDAEKWWDNKKKEIDSWTTLKSKLIDTFGPLEFRHKYENKTFDDVDQLLKALIQYEENRLRPPYDEYNQTTNSGREGQPTIWNQQHFSEAVNQVASNHQRLPWNNKSTAIQQPINRAETNNNAQQLSHPN
ncbi:unnamed protein product [Adineta ricciae]|uniref:Retrotransposon gag domain-containing protein n=1 Tax=Adineta ricciae TaxID=249248 RepID=A0A814LSH5_ADIRI|nr:unnamed protein product [Adineta ricciae]CAF1461182.1 unnamed protein product [Adineta ricciae]